MKRQFVESMKRLYENNKIDKNKVVELFKSGKITKEEEMYILDAHQGLWYFMPEVICKYFIKEEREYG